MRSAKYLVLLVAALALWSCSGNESGTVQSETKQASPGARSHKAPGSVH